MFEILPSFIDTYAAGAAALAADWYDELREEHEVPGTFTAVIPDIGDQGADELAGFASEAILRDEPDWELFRSRVEGRCERRIANAARETVMTSSVEDPKARGWKRVVRPGRADSADCWLAADSPTSRSSHPPSARMITVRVRRSRRGATASR